MDEEEELREFEIYKIHFNIKVDEAAPHFKQWVKVFLLMMRKAEVNATLAAERLPRPPQLRDCCIICSGDEDDLSYAQHFQRVLTEHGFIACVLQESQLVPGGVMDDVQEMLDGSTVVFLLCSPSLMQDRGIAKMAFQDQLQTHITPGTRRGKKIVPVNLPRQLQNRSILSTASGSSSYGSLSSPVSMGSSCDRGDYRAVSQRRVPFGITLFSPITLETPDVYMKQVRRCISLDEQRDVRDSVALELEKRRLFQNEALRTMQKKAIVEAVKLFEKSEGTLMQLARCMTSGPQPTDLGARMDLMTDGAVNSATFTSGNNGTFARYPPGFDSLGAFGAPVHQQPVQIVNISNCSDISVGTSYHVQETTSL